MKYPRVSHVTRQQPSDAGLFHPVTLQSHLMTFDKRTPSKDPTGSAVFEISSSSPSPLRCGCWIVCHFKMVYLSFQSVILLQVCCGGIGWRSTVPVDASGDASLSPWWRHPNKLWQPPPRQVRRSRQRWVATVTQDCSIPRRRMLLRRHGCQEKQKPNEGSSFAMENVDACPSLTISATVGPQKSMLSSSLLSSLISSACSLRGGGPPDGEVSALVDDAYAWCMNLGQPSALIAGAVIATIYENIGNGDLDILPQDSPFTKFKKRLTSSLLISAFGLEIIAIFVTIPKNLCRATCPQSELVTGVFARPKGRFGCHGTRTQAPMQDVRSR